MPRATTRRHSDRELAPPEYRMLDSAPLDYIPPSSLVACSPRLDSDTHTHRQTNYHNSLLRYAPRVNNIVWLSSHNDYYTACIKCWLWATTYIYYITDKNRSLLVPGVDKLIILNELKMVDNEETLKQWTGAFINVMTHFWSIRDREKQTHNH